MPEQYKNFTKFKQLVEMDDGDNVFILGTLSADKAVEYAEAQIDKMHSREVALREIAKARKIKYGFGQINDASSVAAKKYETTIDSDAVNALLHAQLDKINGGSVSSKGTKEEQMDKKMNKLQSLLAAKTINDGQYEKMMVYLEV